MAVQLENGYTQIANEVLEKIYQQSLTSSEFRVLFFVIRKTWGWKKKADKISLSQIAKEVGIPRPNASDIVQSLVAKRLLIKTKGFVNTLQFNKNHGEWIVAKRLPPSSHTTTTLVATVLPGLVAKRLHTKETIKETITKETNTNVLEAKPKIFGREDINECQSYFLGKFQIPEEDGSVKWNRIYWSNLIKKSKTGVQGVKWLIDLASKDEFWKNNITSAKDLYTKRIKIIARQRGNIPKIASWKDAL